MIVKYLNQSLRSNLIFSHFYPISSTQIFSFSNQQLQSSAYLLLGQHLPHFPTVLKKGHETKRLPLLPAIVVCHAGCLCWGFAIRTFCSLLASALLCPSGAQEGSQKRLLSLLSSALVASIPGSSSLPLKGSVLVPFSSPESILSPPSPYGTIQSAAPSSLVSSPSLWTSSESLGSSQNSAFLMASTYPMRLPGSEASSHLPDIVMYLMEILWSSWYLWYQYSREVLSFSVRRTPSSPSCLSIASVSKHSCFHLIFLRICSSFPFH